MPRSRARRAALGASSDDDDDAPQASPESPASRAPDGASPSLKYVPGTTGKQARARAKLLRNASRMRREARDDARRVSPSGSETETADEPRSGDAGELAKLRALLERATLCEGEELRVECARGEERETMGEAVVSVLDASAFVAAVRTNEASLRDARRVTDARGGTVWPTGRRGEEGASTSRVEGGGSVEETPKDALDAMPQEVWERIFGCLSLREATRLAATCKSLWVLSQREFVRDARCEAMFGRPRASNVISDAELMVSFLSSERWFGGLRAHETLRPKPVHHGLGPSFVRNLLADETTVTSFDREKVKIWYHGAGIRGDDEPGGRLASLFVEKKSAATRGLTALAINQTSIVCGDDGGRLRIWDSDTLEYVQKRAHAIPNDHAVSALCGIPATSLVVCSSAQSPTLEIWDTEEVASVTSVPLGDLILDGGEHGVTCMGMFGGNSYGRMRSHVAATSRMWVGTTFQKVVGVDLNRATFVDTLNLPESHGPDACILALAVNGPLITAVVKDVGAVMWDRRGMPQEQIVATFDSCFPSMGGESEQSSCVDLEDFALWMSNPGDPGLTVYDIRKTFGPPRRQERWVSAAHELRSPACILRPRRSTRGFSEEINVGCFARVPGSPGAVIVAPDSTNSEARCSIFSRKNELLTTEEIDSLTAVSIEDTWRSRRARKGKPPTPKTRGRHPKRPGLYHAP